MTPKALILKASGTNCDEETLAVCNRVGFQTDLKLMKTLRQNKDLGGYDFVIVPGGFSYGDYLGAGVIWGNEIRRFLFRELLGIVDRGGLIMGVCNGFQALVKCGLLPFPLEADSDRYNEVSLKKNARGLFECRWIRLKVVSDKCIFLKDLDLIELPVNHAEGRFVAADEVISQLEDRGQIVLKYVDGNGMETMEYPYNPNGSMKSIAGISDESGRIFGLMPHPDRFFYSQQHPEWLRKEIDICHGLAIFENAFNYLKGR